jgi:class 3 adenylate cyclase
MESDLLPPWRRYRKPILSSPAKDTEMPTRSVTPIRKHRPPAFLRINPRTKKGEYRVIDSSNQSKRCKRIALVGFDRLPSGFYKNDGYGLTGGGNLLVQELYDRLGKEVSLTVTAAGKSALDVRGRKTKLTLLHADLQALNATARTVKRKRNEETRAAVLAFLGRHFQQFREHRDAQPQYVPGTLSETLRSSGVTSLLNTDDRAELEKFIPDYLSNVPGTLRANNKLRIIFDSMDAGKKVHLEKVLKEFRRKLARQVQNEALWQQFLSEHILIFRNTYGEVLEKRSVSLEGKFPDFMLIDPYSYLDIYEIKKPHTALLSYDNSRNNYYWSTDLSKAISQVENYAHQVNRHCDTLINDIRRSKGLEVSIVRPRAYIIAGMRGQLTTTKMKDDFRILNESLKNIDVILYDDLLENLEAFVKRIGSPRDERPPARTR